MTGLFLQILNMSISASWLVVMVIMLRFVLRKAPKWVNVLLWGMVAVRLVCPFSIESALSLIPSKQTVSPEIMLDPTPQVYTGVAVFNSTVNPVISTAFAPNPGDSVNPLQIWIPLASALWIGGMVIMFLYTAISYLGLRKKVATAVILRDNIFQSENVGSPFVLGVIKPRIYLPFGMDGQEMEYVISHENAHIRRKDHWWKPFGFLLLTIHWFNPLMWLGYILLCRDIELACDEKVIKTLGWEQRADYTQALVACSVNHRLIAACPLAFGEVGVKERVKSVMNYKKPAFWIIVLAVIACVVVAVCFLTDPMEPVSNPWVQEYVYGTVEKEDFESISEDFAIGADRYGRAVFKDPHKAFDTFTALYAEGISLVQEQHGLAPITRKNYDAYKTFGWQTTADSEAAREQAAFVSKFLDIYENSFAPEPAAKSLEELREGYSARQAAEDGCVVLDGSVLLSGGERWLDFVAQTREGNADMVRIYQAYSDYGENYYVYDLSYDGESYNLRHYDRTGDNNEEFLSEQSYKYLVHSQFTTMAAVTDNYLLADSLDVTAEGYFNSMASSVLRPENDIYNHCRNIYCVVLERLDSERIRGVPYVSNQCIYMSPLSSYSGGNGDSGYRYVISDDSITLINRATGVHEICSLGNWEIFPYSQEEWEELFQPMGLGTLPGPRSGFDNVRYKPVDERRFLMKLDDALWLVELHGGHVWSIYSLVPEGANGMAQWDFCPAVSALSPVFGFCMDGENISIHASCEQGTLVSFDESSETGYPTGNVLEIPAGCGLYWGPMDENGTINSDAEVLVILYRDDEMLASFTILISGEAGEGACAMHYTATIVGYGVRLNQAAEFEGGVITLTQDDRAGLIME